MTHDPSVLTGLAGGLPADQKSVTIGYDSSNPDNQLISNLIQTQLAAAGLTAKVQAYPTSEIYGWVGSDGQSAPEIMAYLGWPDAPSPYTWGHISWDADGGLNFFGCSAPPVTEALAKRSANRFGRGLLDGRSGSGQDGLLAQHRRRQRLHGRPAVAQGRRAGARRDEPELAAAGRAVGGLMATLVRKSGVRRIILLTLGWEELPKSVSVYGAPPEERMREPVPGVLLQTDGGWVLLDTGFNTALVRDPALYRRFFPGVEYRPVLPGPGEPIEQRLAEVGVDFDAIHTVAVSHLHHDHAGGLKLFAGKVPVHAQRRELEYGLSNHPEPERNAIVRVDFDDPNIDWQLADGEAEIAPGSRRCRPTDTRPGIRASWSSSTSRWAATDSCSRSTPPT